MKRKDCAYCIDLDEQGALCDHPLRWDCGEPVEARCSSRCADYERRISVTEALSRIHNLEAKLAESEKYRTRYADILIPIMAENSKLRELARRYGEYTDQDRCEGCVCKSRCNDGDVDECWKLTEIRGLARELGIEVR